MTNYTTSSITIKSKKTLTSVCYITLETVSMHVKHFNISIEKMVSNIYINDFLLAREQHLTYKALWPIEWIYAEYNQSVIDTIYRTKFISSLENVQMQGFTERCENFFIVLNDIDHKKY